MLINIAKPSDLTEADVTPESIYLSRRRFMGGVVGLGAGLALSNPTHAVGMKWILDLDEHRVDHR